MTTPSRIPEIGTAADPFLRKVFDLLTPSVVPLVEAAGAGLLWRDASASQWVGGHTSCREIFLANEREIRPVFPPVPLRREGKESGCLVLFSAGGETVPPPALQELLKLIARQVDLESQEESWLEELSESWESLDSLYEMNSDFRFFQNPEELLARILRRAASRSRSLHALLWIEESGRLKASGEAGSAPAGSRDPSDGWIGKTLRARASIVFNQQEHIAALQDLEEELRGARRLVIAPVATAQQTLGALEVWDDGEKSPPFTSSFVRQIEALALQAAMVLETERSYRASVENERLRNEVEIAARIQQLLLSAVPPDRPQLFRIGVLSEPSRQVDGDFYDFVEYANGLVDVFVGDVMGKGVPAALLGAATKTNLLRSALGLMSGQAALSAPPSPELIVAEAHARLGRQLVALETFVTLSYLRIDPGSGACALVDCGHVPVLQWDSRTQEVHRRCGDNLPLGIDATDVPGYFPFVVSPGDTVVLYSDGLTEARAPGGEMFGEARLADAVRRYCILPPDALVRALRHEVAAFSGASIGSDDLTCLAIRFGPTPSGSESEAVFWSTLDSLPEFRRWLKAGCAGWAMPEDGVSALELAGTEVLSNIVRHAYGGRPGCPVLVNARFEPESGIRVELVHWGEPYCGPAAPAPSFDKDSEGGFGLYIISQLVDKIRYEKLESGASRVRLYKSVST